MLNVGGSTATVTGWTSSAFDAHCNVAEPYYVGAASWSPDDATVYIGTTGLGAYNAPGMEGLLPITGALYVNSTKTAVPYGS